jgi:molybdopterin-guanine dinucleotide biosynthesis protein B
MAPPVVSIVSKKNAGKTTLLEKLIPVLKQRGYRIGTIKHDTHGFDIDHEGKDTWRHKQAGAATVVISCPWKLSLVKDVREEIALDEIVARYFADVDIVLTEGYKKADTLQIEVFRSKAHASPIASGEGGGTLIAMVSDVAIDLGVPRFDINDVTALADFIETTFLKVERQRA